MRKFCWIYEDRFSNSEFKNRVLVQRPRRRVLNPTYLIWGNPVKEVSYKDFHQRYRFVGLSKETR